MNSHAFKDVMLKLRNYLGVNVFSALIIFSSIIVYSKIMSLEEMGLVGVFLSVLSVYTIFSGMNFNQSVVRMYNDEAIKFDGYLSSISWSLAIIFIFISLLSILASSWLSRLTNLPEYFFYWLPILGFMNAIKLIYDKVLVSAEKSVSFIKINALFTLFKCFLGVSFCMYYGGYEARLIGEAVIITIFFVFSCVWIRNHIGGLLKFYIKAAYVKEAFKFSLPRLPFAFSLVVLHSSDRLMLSSLSGIEEAGIYTLAYSFGAMIALVISSITPAILPNYYRLIKLARYEELDSINIKLFSIICCLGFLICLFIDDFVNLFLDEKYADVSTIIPFIVLGYIFHAGSSIFCRIFDYKKSTYLLSLIAFIAAVVNILLNLILIPEMSSLGAAISTAVSFLAMFFLSYVFSVRYAKTHTTPMSRLLAVMVFFICLYAIGGDLVFIYKILFLVILLPLLYVVSKKILL